MSRRIDIELTSARDDGSWTWRAAGAREPRGVLDGSLLPSGASTGNVLRADVETGLDGTTVLAVLPPKGPRAEPDRIELVGSGDPEQWVTTVLAPGRPRRDRDDRGGGRDRRDGKGGRPRQGGRDDRSRGREGGGGPPRDGRPRPARGEGRPSEGAKSGGGGSGGGGRGRSSESRPRPPRPPVDTRPKPKRLRPNRTHRKAALAELPAEQQPVAEQVLKGGIPAVRAAVAKQNEQARAEGKPEVKADQLIELAEKLLPRLRAAEWRDRAEAAMADLDELDLRDLRSVIVAADQGARDDESRALATSLREGLARRVDSEQASWLQEIASTLGEGRVVRALRLSSRPPKAGEPLPADLATRLIEATGTALSADTVSDRWATVLDALSFSPIHLRVEPASVPAEPDETLLTAVRATASRVPQIAARFGVDPATAPPPPRRGGPQGGRRRPAKKAGGNPPVPPPPPVPESPATPAVEAEPSAPEPTPTEAATPTEAPTPAAEAPAPPAEPEPAAPEAGTPASAPEPEPAAPEPVAPEPVAPEPEAAAEPVPAPVPEPGTPEAEPAPVAEASPESPSEPT